MEGGHKMYRCNPKLHSCYKTSLNFPSLQFPIDYSLLFTIEFVFLIILVSSVIFYLYCGVIAVELIYTSMLPERHRNGNLAMLYLHENAYKNALFYSLSAL